MTLTTVLSAFANKFMSHITMYLEGCAVILRLQVMSERLVFEKRPMITSGAMKDFNTHVLGSCCVEDR